MKSKNIAKVMNTCVACGTCIQICPLRALRIHKGIIACVDEDKCAGCAKCMKGCPGNLIEIVRRKSENE